METFPPIPEFVKLETRVAQILTEQELHGWYFDKDQAWKLASSLRSELESINELLLHRHPYIPGDEFTPKRANKTKGYVAGAPFVKLKDFNPTSRDHIAWILKDKYGWNPSSAGKCNFRGSRKSTAYAAQVVTQDAGRVAVSHGMKEVIVKLNGPGMGRDSAVRALQSLGMIVTEIVDVTPVPHNGCRPPKRRRV